MASPGSLSSSHGKLNDDPRLKAQGDTFSHLFSLDSQVHSAPLLSRREWYTDTMASLSLNESLQRSCDKNTGSNISSETKPLAHITYHRIVAHLLSDDEVIWPVILYQVKCGAVELPPSQSQLISGETFTGL